MADPKESSIALPVFPTDAPPSDDEIAWLIEDTRPPTPMYAAVNEDGEWYGEWNASNPNVVRFADKASAEATMRWCRRHDRRVIVFFNDRHEAREHMWAVQRTDPRE